MVASLLLFVHFLILHVIIFGHLSIVLKNKNSKIKAGVIILIIPIVKSISSSNYFTFNLLSQGEEKYKRLINI